MDKPTVKIEFDNEEAARQFMRWLDGQGEQDYWTWMEYRESETKGDITATRFDYHLKNLTVKTKCGRLDDDK